MNCANLRVLRQAFIETANLIVLSIIAIAAYLTDNWYLLGGGAALEIVYLIICRWKLEVYQKRLALRPKVECLDYVLLLVTVAGLVVILFFGFGKHLLNHRFPDFTHAEGWEAGALFWTFIFLLYYLAKFRGTGNMSVDKLIILVLFGVGYICVHSAWKTMDNPFEHVLYVAYIAGLFFIIDLFMSIKHPDQRERRLSRASFWWADVPMVTVFGVFLLYLWRHPDTEHPETFVSGVVACALLFSNVIFIATEFEFLQPPPLS